MTKVRGLLLSCEVLHKAATKLALFQSTVCALTSAVARFLIRLLKAMCCVVWSLSRSIGILFDNVSQLVSRFFNSVSAPTSVCMGRRQ